MFRRGNPLRVLTELMREHLGYSHGVFLEAAAEETWGVVAKSHEDASWDDFVPKLATAGVLRVSVTVEGLENGI